MSLLLLFNSAGGAAPAFSPTDITGLELWLDAADASTITETGGAVSQWDDKSGQDNHFTQSTGSIQPVTGTDTINGRNALDFLGHHMQMPTGLYSIPDDPHTIIAVVQIQTNPATVERLIWNTSRFTNQRGQLFTSPGSAVGELMYRYGDPAVNTATSGATFNTDPTALIAGVDGTDVFVGKDGGTLTTGTGYGSQFVAINGKLGEATYTGDLLIAEVLVYSKALSTSELNDAGGYLGTKWGFTWNTVT